MALQTRQITVGDICTNSKGSVAFVGRMRKCFAGTGEDDSLLKTAIVERNRRRARRKSLSSDNPLRLHRS